MAAIVAAALVVALPSAKRFYARQHSWGEQFDSGRRLHRAYGLGRLVERLKLTNELDVFASFPERRDSIAALPNRLLAGVVRGERKRQVVVEQIEQVTQVANADPNVRRR